MTVSGRRRTASFGCSVLKSYMRPTFWITTKSLNSSDLAFHFHEVFVEAIDGLKLNVVVCNSSSEIAANNRNSSHRLGVGQSSRSIRGRPIDLPCWRQIKDAFLALSLRCHGSMRLTFWLPF